MHENIDWLRCWSEIATEALPVGCSNCKRAETMAKAAAHRVLSGQSQDLLPETIENLKADLRGHCMAYTARHALQSCIDCEYQEQGLSIVEVNIRASSQTGTF